MRILLCCEFYAPSVGGVQEVMKQIAERLVSRGHEVTAATTKLPTRDFNSLNGVNIVDFKISGNLVNGIVGDVEAYRDFVLAGDFDVIMVKAAQQWTFDALWEILPQIKMRKVLIPCGFSGLGELAYSDYFKKMPAILSQFDHLIFYASDYRDINFARKHGLDALSVIPNGASEKEFLVEPDPDFRARHGIDPDDFLFLTVGSFTGIKGHFEVTKAFAEMKLDRPATLILNGNIVPRMTQPALKSIAKKHARGVLQMLGLKEKPNAWMDLAESINEKNENKKVIITDLPRPELVQAFIAADLFVFASNIEYSPLVLFEAAAAGTPFLSVPVGNAAEIASWTGAGVICPAQQDERGYTRVDPTVLAEYMSELAGDRSRLNQLGTAGRKSWLERFTWDKIVIEYEEVLRGSNKKSS